MTTFQSLNTPSFLQFHLFHKFCSKRIKFERAGFVEFFKMETWNLKKMRIETHNLKKLKHDKESENKIEIDDAVNGT